MSVVVPAYNLARFLPAALDSALAQGVSVEVIVIDDGSTDETPQVLAAYADRVKAIRQPNAGFVRAVDRGLAEVTGEHVALLDADDAWPRDRLRRHLEVLDVRPEVGLVQGDMEVVDAHGATLHPSFLASHNLRPGSGRALGRLLSRNFVSGGACTFRASLLPAIHPISPAAVYPDWWIAACVCAVAEVEHVDAISNRYRFHGANMGLGADASKLGDIARRELPWRTWMLGHLVDDDTVTPAHIAQALAAWNQTVQQAGAQPDAAAVRHAVDAMDSPAGAPAPALIALEAGDPLTLVRATDLAAAAPEWDGVGTLAILHDGEAQLEQVVAVAAGLPQEWDLVALATPRTPPAWRLLEARARGYLATTTQNDDSGSRPGVSSVLPSG